MIPEQDQTRLKHRLDEIEDQLTLARESLRTGDAHGMADQFENISEIAESGQAIAIKAHANS